MSGTKLWKRLGRVAWMSVALTLLAMVNVIGWAQPTGTLFVGEDRMPYGNNQVSAYDVATGDLIWSTPAPSTGTSGGEIGPDGQLYSTNIGPTLFNPGVISRYDVATGERTTVGDHYHTWALGIGFGNGKRWLSLLGSSYQRVL